MDEKRNRNPAPGVAQGKVCPDLLVGREVVIRPTALNPSLLDDDRLDRALVGRLLDQIFQLRRNLLNNNLSDLLAHLEYIRTGVHT